MPRTEIFTSAIAVIRDQAAILPAFVDEMSQTLESNYANYELLLVDNGSVDDSAGIVSRLMQQYRCVRYLRLTRTTDIETATMAALDCAIGDFVVTLDPDLDPPAELVAMVDACRADAELVVGQDCDPPATTPFYRALRHLFRSISRRLMPIDSISNATGYRVLSRQAVNALVKVRVRKRYFAIVAADIGLLTIVHPYRRILRSGGRPKTSLLAAIRIGTSVIVHNSLVPLRIASAFGLIGSILSFGYSLYAVTVYLIKQDVMPGWTTLSLAMSGLFALAFLILALIGEYLGRLLEESTERPLYHVREEQSSAIMLANSARRNVLDRSVESASKFQKGV